MRLQPDEHEDSHGSGGGPLLNWAVMMNLLLGLFNSLPALPLSY